MFILDLDLVCKDVLFDIKVQMKAVQFFQCIYTCNVHDCRYTTLWICVITVPLKIQNNSNISKIAKRFLNFTSFKSRNVFYLLERQRENKTESIPVQILINSWNSSQEVGTPFRSPTQTLEP